MQVCQGMKGDRGVSLRICEKFRGPELTVSARRLKSHFRSKNCLFGGEDVFFAYLFSEENTFTTRTAFLPLKMRSSVLKIVKNRKTMR